MDSVTFIPWDVPGKNGIDAFFTEETFTRVLGKETLETRLARHLEKTQKISFPKTSETLFRTETDVKTEPDENDGPDPTSSLPLENESDNSRSQRSSPSKVSYWPVSNERPKHQSSLTLADHRRYLELVKRVKNNAAFPSNMTDLEMEEFKSLQETVQKEQSQFQGFLKKLSQHAKSDYEFMQTDAGRYVAEKLGMLRKRAERYPRYYNALETIPLARDGEQPASLVLQYIRPLLELGVVPKAVMPAVFGGPGRPLPELSTGFKQIDDRFPVRPTVKQSDSVWDHETCSRDQNAEVLAVRNNCHVVMSAAAMKRLVDTQDSEHGKYWEVPVSVRQYQLQDGDRTVQHQVLYFDRPLIQCSEMKMRDKNKLFHKYALKAFITNNEKNGHVFTMPKHQAKRKRVVVKESKIASDMKTVDKNVLESEDSKQHLHEMKENKERNKRDSPDNDSDLFPAESMSIDDLEMFGAAQKDSGRKTSTAAKKGISTGSGLFGSGEVNIDDLETFGMGLAGSQRLKTATGVETLTKSNLQSFLLGPSDRKKAKREVSEITSDSKAHGSVTTEVKEKLPSKLIEVNSDSSSVQGISSTVTAENSVGPCISQPDVSLCDDQSDSGKKQVAELQSEDHPSLPPEPSLVPVSCKSESDNSAELGKVEQQTNSLSCQQKQEESESDLTEKAETDLTKQAATDLIKQAHTDLTEKAETDITEQALTDLTEQARTDLTRQGESDLNKKADDILVQQETEEAEKQMPSRPSKHDVSRQVQPAFAKPARLSEARSNFPSPESDSDAEGLVIDIPDFPDPSPSMGIPGEVSTVRQPEELYISGGCKAEREDPASPPGSPAVETPASPRCEAPASPQHETPESPIKSPSALHALPSEAVVGLAMKCVVIPLDVDTEDENVMDYSSVGCVSKSEAVDSVSAGVKLEPTPVKDQSKNTARKQAEPSPVRRSSRLKDNSRKSLEPSSPKITKSKARFSDVEKTAVSPATRSSPRNRQGSEQLDGFSSNSNSESQSSVQKTSPASGPSAGDTPVLAVPVKRTRGRPRKDSVPVKKEIIDSGYKNRLTRQQSLSSDNKEHTVSSDKGQQGVSRHREEQVNPSTDTKEEAVVPVKRKRGRPPKAKPVVPSNSVVPGNSVEAVKESNPEPMETDIKSSNLIKLSKPSESDMKASSEPSSEQNEIKSKEKTEQTPKKPTLASCPLDAILDLQSEMLSTGNSQTPKQESLPKEVFLYPEKHNVTYHMWHMAGYNILVRCGYHGFLKDMKHQGNFLHVSPKLEYQPVHGHEQLTESEVAQEWMSLYLRPNCSLLRARINAYTSEIMLLEEENYQTVIPPSSAFSPSKAFSQLQNILETLNKAGPGQYLLSHTPGEPHLKLMKATEGNKRGSYDLHFHHLNPLPGSVRQQSSWVPIDATLPLLHAKRTNRIPLTVQPIDFKPVLKRKQKKRKRKGEL